MTKVFCVISATSRMKFKILVLFIFLAALFSSNVLKVDSGATGELVMMFLKNPNVLCNARHFRFYWTYFVSFLWSSNLNLEYHMIQYIAHKLLLFQYSDFLYALCFVSGFSKKRPLWCYRLIGPYHCKAISVFPATVI